MFRMSATNIFGNTVEFVSEDRNWEDAGYSCDKDGRVIKDPKRNTVIRSESIDMKWYGYYLTDNDMILVRDAYAGDGERIGDRGEFLEWLRVGGFDESEVQRFSAMFAEELTNTCIYCGDAVPYRADGHPIPDADDDEAWREEASHHLDGCEWVGTRAYRANLD